MSYLVNALNEMDQNLIKCASCLYSADTLTKNDAMHLQIYLEEAIKSKSGISKDFSGIVMASFKPQRLEEFKPIIYEESKGSNSDNELELDLLKDDLMCIVCHEMDVGARNRLVECSDCHALYHQECHRPVITIQDSFDSWVCQKCKDASKKAKLSTSSAPSSTTNICNCSGNTCCVKCSPTKPLPTTSSHRHSSSAVSSSSSSTYKVSSSSGSKSSNVDKYSKSGVSSSSSVSSLKVNSSSGSTVPKSSSSITSSRSTVTPNINIISADKRLQIMKKKAAKLQEKRKQLPR